MVSFQSEQIADAKVEMGMVSQGKDLTQLLYILALYPLSSYWTQEQMQDSLDIRRMNYGAIV